MSVAPAMARTRERHARWPWVALVGFLVLAGVALILVADRGASIAEQAPFVVAFGMFGVVGALLLSRNRGNVIGALFLYASCMSAAAFLAIELAIWRIGDGGIGSGPTVALIVLANIGWILGLVPSLIFLFMVFPDGRLPSRRWRPFAAFVVASLLAVLVAQTFGVTSLEGPAHERFPNPLYVGSIDRALGWVNDAGWLFLVTVGGAFAALVLRFRRSRGVERQQLKWFSFAGAVVVSSAIVSELVAAFAPRFEILTGFVSGAAFLMLPVTVGLAVMRYRLYDLDVVVRKTLVYAALAVFATLVYLAIVIGVGAWVGRDDPLLTMVAAVVVAVTFQPVRQRLTHVANRLVYGPRATPYEVLAEFSERVSATYGDEDVLERMALVLGQGVGAERADIWLKVDDQLRNVAVWPSDASPIGSVELPNGRLPSIADVDRLLAVEHAGELLGALAIRKPPNDPVSPVDEKLVADLAQQAGLVLRNVRLTEELRARLDDLRAAQKRLVTAQDEERRRLERNIHDGAQQQLVALAVKARLARSLAERDPAKAAEMLEQIESETQTALDDLRDLARGIYPPLLADKGLAAAISAQARKAPFAVEVRADDVGRYPAEVEAAVYFSCLEVLQNAAKYADATDVVVTLSERGGTLTFEVSDDGRGFDASATSYGTGLQGIADRLVALDGRLSVRSEPGHGTTVVGSVPLLEPAATSRADRGSAA